MIEAQDILVKMRLADYPNMKNNDRRKWFREVRAQAYFRTKSTETMTTEELAAFLRAKVGNG